MLQNTLKRVYVFKSAIDQTLGFCHLDELSYFLSNLRRRNYELSVFNNTF